MTERGTTPQGLWGCQTTSASTRIFQNRLRRVGTGKQWASGCVRPLSVLLCIQEASSPSLTTSCAQLLRNKRKLKKRNKGTCTTNLKNTFAQKSTTFITRGTLLTHSSRGVIAHSRALLIAHMYTCAPPPILMRDVAGSTVNDSKHIKAHGLLCKAFNITLGAAAKALDSWNITRRRTLLKRGDGRSKKRGPHACVK